MRSKNSMTEAGMRETMSIDETVQDTVYGMIAHDDRSSAVSEVHARPHLLIQAPRCLLQFAFMTEGDQTKDQEAMDALSERMGVTHPGLDASLHGLTFTEGELHCEKHTEFSTYLWSTPIDVGTGVPLGEDPFKNEFTSPGPVISGVRLKILPWTTETMEKEMDLFDPISVCYSLVENGNAAIVTDFKQDKDGLTQILILDKNLSEASAGALAQRLLEIETYRTLALLSLPLTRSMTTELRRMESQLAHITEEMRADLSSRKDSNELLTELTSLAAELEASAAANLYRFGASRAYYEIVEERLKSLGEQAVSGFSTWHEFLYRRIAPAIRTCQSVKERQAKLSDKLTRAISLLRSWIDVELERQNRDLLASMNNRAKLQLRLQQTVEGLSVAAISYYIVSLFAYLIKGIPGIYEKVSPDLAIAVAIPIVTLAIWWTVRRIKIAHGDTPVDEKHS